MQYSKKFSRIYEKTGICMSEKHNAVSETRQAQHIKYFNKMFQEELNTLKRSSGNN
jgi:hypothetical protein